MEHTDADAVKQQDTHVAGQPEPWQLTPDESRNEVVPRSCSTSTLVSHESEEELSAALRFLKPKRSSSLSNDVAHERDRFTARHRNLNVSLTPFIDDQSALRKTKKLNSGCSPLSSESEFYQARFRLTQPLDIHELSALDLEHVFEWYFAQPLPETSEMFPWLHGLHKNNFSQRSFFLSQQLGHSHTCHFDRPEGARFLMCVEFGDLESPRKLRNLVSAEEILRKIDCSRAEVEEEVARSLRVILKDQDVSLDLVALIVADCFATGHLPELLNLDPDRGVSLRNFQIQVCKAACCLDFVVHNERSASKGLARLLRIAQLRENSKFGVFLLNVDADADIWTHRDFKQTKGSGLDATKKTQLFTNHASLLEAKTFASWDVDYQIKEKVETTRMSAASRLHLNVWVGNFWDHEIMMHRFNSDYRLPEVEVNPEKDHLKSTLLATFSSLDDKTLFQTLSPPRAHWKLFVHCHNEAKFPDSVQLADLLFKYTIASRRHTDTDEVHHLEFPASGSIGIGDCKQHTLMAIVNLCKLLYLYLSLVLSESLASLIYCSDGYTELLLLMLCYVIYAEDLPLGEAMLKIHEVYERPFFLFNTDAFILRKLQPLLRRFSPKHKKIDWGLPEQITDEDLNDILLAPRPRSASLERRKLGYIENDSDSLSDSDEDMSPTYLCSDWVADLEGLMPSRILPYLYLGSLRHANSLTLLSRLRINLVISVGEDLDWLNGHKFQHNNDIRVDVDGKNSIYHIRPLTQPLCTVRSVLKVNNLQDDGIDDLAHSLPAILAFIDAELRRLQQTRIMVHCRVGVSRSATVVIAEVMRRLQLSLPKAYMFVRVRRLNIVIQPNLRFMYELFKWEEQKRRDEGQLREVDWFVMCREIKRLNQPFIR